MHLTHYYFVFHSFVVLGALGAKPVRHGDRFEEFQAQQVVNCPVSDGRASRMPTVYYPPESTLLNKGGEVEDEEFFDDDDDEEDASSSDLDDYDTCDTDYNPAFDDPTTRRILPVEEQPPMGPSPLIKLGEKRRPTLFLAFLQVLLGIRFPPFQIFNGERTRYLVERERIIRSFIDRSMNNGGRVSKKMESLLGKALDGVRQASIQYEFSYSVVFGEDGKWQMYDPPAAENLCNMTRVPLESLILERDFQLPKGLGSTVKRLLRKVSDSIDDPSGGVAFFFASMLQSPESSMSFKVYSRTVSPSSTSSYNTKDSSINVRRAFNQTVLTIPVRKQLEITSTLDRLLAGTFEQSTLVDALEPGKLPIKCKQQLKLESFPKLQLFHLKRTPRDISRQRHNRTHRLNTLSHRPVDIPLQLKYPFNSVFRAAILQDSRPDHRHAPRHSSSRLSVLTFDRDEEGDYYALYDHAAGTSYLIQEEEAMRRLARHAIYLFYQRDDTQRFPAYKHSPCRPALHYPTVITPMPDKRRLGHIVVLDFDDVFESSTNSRSNSSSTTSSKISSPVLSRASSSIPSPIHSSIPLPTPLPIFTTTGEPVRFLDSPPSEYISINSSDDFDEEDDEQSGAATEKESEVKLKTSSIDQKSVIQGKRKNEK